MRVSASESGGLCWIQNHAPRTAFVNVRDLPATSVHDVKGRVKRYALLDLYFVARLIDASPRRDT